MQQYSKPIHTVSNYNFLNKIIVIIGYGRFGKLWANMCAQVAEQVYVYDILFSQKDMSLQNTVCQFNQKINRKVKHSTLTELYKADIVFYCVPISQLQASLQETQQYLAPHTIVCDTCSVKELPIKWMKKLLPAQQSIVGAHPLFGQDSVKSSEQNFYNVVLTRVQISDKAYKNFIALFQAMGMKVHQMSAQEHDEQAIYSQGLTHLIGRVLKKLELSRGPVTTKGYESLLEIIEQTCNDSEDLFYDIQNFNQGSAKMWEELSASLTSTITQILDNKTT